MLSTTDGAAVTVGGIVVTAIELIQDEGGAVTADVLDLGQLLVRHEVASGVTRVRGEQHLSTTSDFLGDLVGVDVIVVFLSQRNGDGSNLCRVYCQHSHCAQSPEDRKGNERNEREERTFLNKLNISEYAE